MDIQINAGESKDFVVKALDVKGNVVQFTDTVAYQNGNAEAVDLFVQPDTQHFKVTWAYSGLSTITASVLGLSATLNVACGAAPAKTLVIEAV